MLQFVLRCALQCEYVAACVAVSVAVCVAACVAESYDASDLPLLSVIYPEYLLQCVLQRVL